MAGTRNDVVKQIAAEALATAAITFLLTFLLVGFDTVSLQGQPLGIIPRFGAVAWAVGLVTAGRVLMALDRHGFHWPIQIFGSLFAAYFIFAGVCGVLEYPAYADLPKPHFDQPMALVIFGIAALIVVGLSLAGRRQRHIHAMTSGQRKSVEARSAARGYLFLKYLGPTLIVFALALPLFANQKWVDALVVALTFIALAWGLNIVVGLAGLLDLGYVAFYAVGAYTYTKMSMFFGLDFWETLGFAGIFAAIFGIVLGFPVLRLRGDYLAIVTLGFGEMIRVTMLNWVDFSNGPAGINNVPYIDFFGVPFKRNPPEGTHSFHTLFGLDYSTGQKLFFMYYVVLFLSLFICFVAVRMRKLPIGRAWEALREDEIACRALGINPTNTKLTAFAIGASFAGLSGAFFATRLGFVSPDPFNFELSAMVLAAVVLGGAGSQVTVALAALVLTIVPIVMLDLVHYRMLVFGVVMVLAMLWRPQGIAGHRRPTVWLHGKKDTPLTTSEGEALA
jgi:branched-chain amino acid transport system permease protein